MISITSPLLPDSPWQCSISQSFLVIFYIVTQKYYSEIYTLITQLVFSLYSFCMITSTWRTVCDIAFLVSFRFTFWSIQCCGVELTKQRRHITRYEVEFSFHEFDNTIASSASSSSSLHIFNLNPQVLSDEIDINSLTKMLKFRKWAYRSRRRCAVCIMSESNNIQTS